MKEKINILFPVETINRELDFRLVLAGLTVDENSRVFIGQHNVLDHLINRMQGGIYLGKHIFKDIFPSVEISPYVKLKKKQFKVIHLDEEGAVYSGDKDYWREKLKVQLNPNYLCEDDYICSWGKFQADFYRSRHPACESRIRETGHPRFDLCKPAYREFFAVETNQLRDKYGDFVLLNSNLSFANNGLGLADMFSERNNFCPSDIPTRTRHIEDWAHTSQVLSNFVKLINRLSGEFPATKFIVRPHPTEDWSFYQTIFRGFSNIFTIHEGAVTPWLFASRLVIHDGCTTGIEAFLGDTPVVSYKSIPNERQDMFIPDNVGKKCFSEEEIIECVKTAFSNGAELLQRNTLNPLVGDLMANFKQDCFQSMLKVIEEAKEDLQKNNVSLQWDETRFHSEEQIRRVKNGVKAAIRPLFKNKYNQHLFYKNQHFYGFEAKKIDFKMKLIRKILQKEITYKLHGDSLISIEKR